MACQRELWPRLRCTHNRPTVLTTSVLPRACRPYHYDPYRNRQRAARRALLLLGKGPNPTPNATCTAGERTGGVLGVREPAGPGVTTIQGGAVLAPTCTAWASSCVLDSGCHVLRGATSWRRDD